MRQRQRDRTQAYAIPFRYRDEATGVDVWADTVIYYREPVERVSSGQEIPRGFRFGDLRPYLYGANVRVEREHKRRVGYVPREIRETPIMQTYDRPGQYRPRGIRHDATDYVAPSHYSRRELLLQLLTAARYA